MLAERTRCRHSSTRLPSFVVAMKHGKALETPELGGVGKDSIRGINTLHLIELRRGSSIFNVQYRCGSVQLNAQHLLPPFIQLLMTEASSLNQRRVSHTVHKKATSPTKAARPAGTATLAAPESSVAVALAAVPVRVLEVEESSSSVVDDGVLVAELLAATLLVAVEEVPVAVRLADELPYL